MTGINQSVNGDEYRVGVHNVIRCVLYALEHNCSLQEALDMAKNDPNNACFYTIEELIEMLEWDVDGHVPNDYEIGNGPKWHGYW